MSGTNKQAYCRSCMTYRDQDFGKYLIRNNQRQFRCTKCIDLRKQVKRLK